MDRPASSQRRPRPLGPAATAVLLALAVVAPAGAATAAGPGASPAATARTTADAQVLVVPGSHRRLPRGATLSGDVAGWSLSLESGPGEDGAPPPSGWRAGGADVLPEVPWPDPAWTSHRYRAGDRDVRWSSSPDVVRSKVVHRDVVDEVPVPSGTGVVTATQDGVVLRGADRELRLLPWTAPGTAVPVPGAEDLRDVWPTGNQPPSRTADAHGALVTGNDDAGRGFLALVDTATPAVHVLARGSVLSAALGEDAVVWLEQDGDEVRARTVPRPSGARGPQPATPATRDATGLPGSPWAASLLPVGGTVLALQPAPRPALLALEADGSVRTVRSGVTSVVPAGPGRVRVVTDVAPGDRRVEQLDVATGAATTELRVPPAPAAARALAFDGSDLVVADDSAAGLARHRVGGSAGSARLEAREQAPAGADVVDACTAPWSRPSGCSRLAAGGGSVALEGGDGVTVLGPQGERWRLSPGVDGGAVAAVSGPHVLARTSWGRSSLWDARTGRAVAATDGADLLEGVLTAASPLDGRVDARDLATGASEVLGERCGAGTPVRTAGSWLSVCGRLVDRGGRGAPLPVGAPVQLGNGFVVRRSSATYPAVLEWAPLPTTAPASTDDLPWQPLGEVADAVAPALTRSGDVAAVAWTTPRGDARVAVLPLTPSPGPVRPTRVAPAPPAPAGLVVTADDGALAVRWSRPADSTVTRAFDVRGPGWPAGARVARHEDGLGADVTGLVNGVATTVEVVGQGTTASSVPARATATPLSPYPPAPRDITAVVDPLTSRVTVRWAWSPDPRTLPARSFEVVVGDGRVTVPASARSATVLVTGRGRTDTWVAAVSERSSTSATGAARLEVPGLDRVAPTVAVPTLPAVATTPDVVVGLAGSDDRRLDRYELRWRRGDATAGQGLGRWEHPRSWSSLRTGRVDARGLTAGWTYCFSARSVDHAGNVSAWSDAACTTRPADDRRLTAASGTWSRATGTAFSGGTVTRSREVFATLTMPRVRGDEVSLVVTTCPTCGRVSVDLAGRYLGYVDLRSRTTRYGHVVRFRVDEGVGGTLRLRHEGKGDVLVDGVAVRAF